MGRNLKTKSRAQGNLVSMLIGMLIAVVVGFQVVIPVIQDGISGLSGTTLTVAQIAPLFVALLVLVGVARPFMRRV